MKNQPFLAFFCLFPLAACAGVPDVPCSTDIECGATPDRAICGSTNVCTAGAARGTLIGRKDGTAGSITLTLVFEPAGARRPTGLAFNPVRPNELWMVNQSDNSVEIVYDLGTPQMRSEHKRDPAAAHFMARPTGLAFASDGSWATCGETDNSKNGGTGFMGPAVFSSDPAIFAKSTSGGLGSHLDMLHASPFCMGITHERGNAYWAFDGEHSAIARYDFREFHEPGGDDHSDGEILVYAAGALLRADGIPSHLAFDPSDSQLYVADTGNHRVVKLDTRSGTPGAELDTLEPTVPRQVDGAVLTDLVPAGKLQSPSGVMLDKDVVYVTDNATSRISAFDRTGRLVRYLDTGLPAGALGDLVVGADGKLYLLDMTTGRVLRVDQR